jgi:hypothetical protein
VAANCGAVSGGTVGEGDTWLGHQLILSTVSTIQYVIYMVVAVTTLIYWLLLKKKNIVVNKKLVILKKILIFKYVLY